MSKKKYTIEPKINIQSEEEFFGEGKHIKSNELRLGNIIEGKTLEGSILHAPVSEITEQGIFLIWSGVKHRFVEERCKGVPLTVEILKACGYWKDKNFWIHQKYRMIERDGKFLPTFGDIAVMGFDLDFVHQLQNFHFVLTSEELKFNEVL